MPRTSGAKKYTTAEVTALLDVVELIKPIGGEMWKRIAVEFNKTARANLWEERDEDSLKAKFKGLVANKKPTGDPNCPSPVKRAKRIKKSIEEGIGADDFESTEDSMLSTNFDAVEEEGELEPILIERPTRITSLSSTPLRRSPLRVSPTSVKKISPFKNKRLKLDSKLANLETQMFQQKQEDELKEMKSRFDNDLKSIKDDMREFKAESRNSSQQLSSQFQQLNTMVMMALLNRIPGNSQSEK